MLLFQRIFDFQKAKVAELTEQRLDHRYTPGAAFPLHTTLTLAGRDCPAKLQNMSGNGVGLLVGRDATVAIGQFARVRFELGPHQLEIDTHLAHIEPQDFGTFCGMQLQFSDFLVQKAYLQLLQPVVIGQSLQQVPADRVIQNEPRFIKQVYRSGSDCVLTVWLEMTMGTPLHSFEFRMHDYFCRATRENAVLEAYLLESADSQVAKLTNPVFDTALELREEIRQLFRWVVPNLSKTIPDDVRAVLLGFAG